MLKDIRYRIEFTFLWLVIGLFRLLPLKAASYVGARIAQSIRFLLSGKNKIARYQIANYLKHPEPEIVLPGLWENLGRLAGEYPHLLTLAKNNIEFENIENLERARKDYKGLFLVSAHMANWEILPPAMLHHFGVNMHAVYRRPNNPYTARYLENLREDAAGKDHHFHTLAKSSKGARAMLKLMKQGKPIGLLIDQKYNQGSPLPFFNHPANTSTSYITLCQKMDYAILPGQVIRHKDDPTRFSLRFFPPISLQDQTGNNRDEDDIATQLNTLMEHWIREHPEQWLWIHKRWGKIKT